MANAKLNIAATDAEHTTFAYEFSTNGGKISARVSVRVDGKPDTRTKEEKARAALKKFERLVQGLSKATADARAKSG